MPHVASPGNPDSKVFIILVFMILNFFVFDPKAYTTVISSWQRSNDSTGKPLRTLRYESVLVSHSNGVFPLLTDKTNETDVRPVRRSQKEAPQEGQMSQTWRTSFDAEAYVDKLISHVRSNKIARRTVKVLLKSGYDGSARARQRLILYRQMGNGQVGLRGALVPRPDLTERSPGFSWTQN